MRIILIFILISISIFADMSKYEHLVNRAFVDNNAAYKLGIDYLLGEHKAQDIQKAHTWIVRASEMGYLPAKITLAKMYTNGVVVKHNYKKAFRLYYQAAKKGHLEARSKVGFFYLKGIGVKASLPKAEYWLRLAANANDAEAIQNLGYLYATSNPPYYKPSAAINILKPLAKAGNTKAIFHLGLLYQLPYTMTRSIDSSLYWFEQAVLLHVDDAKCPLYRLYKEINRPKWKQISLISKDFNTKYCD